MEAQTEIPAPTVADLVASHERLCELMATAAERKSAYSAAQAFVDAEEARLMQMMHDAKLKNFRSKYGQCILVAKFQVKKPQTPEAKVAFWKWAEENGHTEALLDVNHNTLNAWFKEQFALAQERQDVDWMPDGLEAPSTRDSLSMRK